MHNAIRAVLSFVHARLSVFVAICAMGCTPLVDNTMGHSETMPSGNSVRPAVPQRFTVSLPGGWSEVSRYDIGEASEGQYEDPAFGTRMTVSLLILDSSIIGALEAEGQRMRRRGWQVHVLDGDAADGMASFVAFSKVRQAIVRAAHPASCPTAAPCVAMFAGSWPSGNSGEGSTACDYIQASFRVVPDVPTRR